MRNRGRYYAEFSPYIIHGVGPVTCNKFALEDVMSVEQLAACDPSELSEVTGISEDVLRRFRLNARSLVSGEVYMVNPFEFPLETVVYLDIETEVSGGKVWLIGCMVDGKVYQFYADSWDEEKSILEEFKDLVDSFPDYTLVSYSGTCFDLRFLEHGFKRHSIECNISDRHVDLCKAVRRCFVFPTQGYGLKQIGSFLGYRFTNPNLDGLEVANLYEEHIEQGLPLDERVFEYSKDDVKSLPYIITTISQPCCRMSWVRTHSTAPGRCLRLYTGCCTQASAYPRQPKAWGWLTQH